MEEQWKRSLRENNSNRRKNNGSSSSFSSALLDTIYRSFDEGENEDLSFYRENNNKKNTVKKTSKQQQQQHSVNNIMNSNKNAVKKTSKLEEELAQLKRASLVERYMMTSSKEVRTTTTTEKDDKVTGVRSMKTNKKSSVEPVLEFKKAAVKDRNASSKVFHSTSSSSDSSTGFSSSETESLYSSSVPVTRLPKPIRTKTTDSYEHEQTKKTRKPSSLSSSDMNRMKSRALKIYSDLKKVKQPISPGGKLATFLNSIITAATPRTRTSRTSATPKASPESKYSVQTPSTTCSSAPSYSRSCLLNKNPTLENGNGTFAGIKRSVRFHDDQPAIKCSQNTGKRYFGFDYGVVAEREYDLTIKCGRDIGEFRDIYENDRKKRLEEIARDIVMRDNGGDMDIDEDDDVESCTSSDLFELEYLSPIRIERYREELPVYETTHLGGILM